MKQLTCEMCGSTDMIKEDGVFVCQSCGCKYSVEEAKKLMIEGTVEIKGTVQVDKNNEIDALLKRVFMFLEEEKWKEADEYCEKVLDIDPENPEAYLGKLMVEYELSYISDITWYTPDFYEKKPKLESTGFYRKMCQYANDTINELLKEREYEMHGISYSDDNSTLEHVGQLVETLIIADGVRIISNRVCMNHYHLKKVIFSETVEVIEEGAFLQCRNLCDITVPNGVKIIENLTFYGCDSLTNVIIPNSVEVIKSSAFAYCPIDNLIIPSSVLKIEDCAFGEDYSNIKSIFIPDSIQEVGNYIFGSEEESDLVNLKTSKRVLKLLVEGGSLINCINLKMIELEDGTIVDPKKVLDTEKKFSPADFEDEKIEIIGPLGKNTIFLYKDSITIMRPSVTIRPTAGHVPSVTIRLKYHEINRILLKGNSLSIYKKDLILNMDEFPSLSSNNHKDLVDLCDKIRNRLLISGNTDYKYEVENISTSTSTSVSSGGCYVATCVYGSYDCPQVWTLRRYRDDTLGATWYGRTFIRTYYAISPTLVKWFGNTNWFKKMWKGKLDRMVIKLQSSGVESTPYEDKNW